MIHGLSFFPPGTYDPSLNFTSFPHAIAQAASWDLDLVARITAASAYEARAISQQAYENTQGLIIQSLMAEGGPLANSVSVAFLRAPRGRTQCDSVAKVFFVFPPFPIPPHCFTLQNPFLRLPTARRFMIQGGVVQWSAYARPVTPFSLSSRPFIPKDSVCAPLACVFTRHSLILPLTTQPLSSLFYNN